MPAIDIKKIIFSKSGKEISWPINSLLRRIIHQREINEIILSGECLTPREFVAHTLQKMQIKYRIFGFKPTAEERYIFASNHPLGGLDGVILADAIGECYIIANDLLTNITPMQEMFVPINKFGKQNHTNRALYYSALASNKPVITFPAGLCSRRHNSKIEDREWSPRFVKDAIRFARPIVPVYIEGHLSRRFYAIHSLRQLLRIRTNIEMILLADEMFKQCGKEFRIAFGEPITIQADDCSNQIAQKIRKNCYALADMLRDI